MALMQAIVARDLGAFGTLYDRYGRVAFGLAYRMLGDAGAAEEVTQDVFHRVWRQAASYRPEQAAVRTWLFRICRNAAIDWRRTRGTRLARETELEAASDVEVSAGVEDRVLARLRDERVRASLETLPREQRDTLALAFWGGLSHGEIAARTGTPLGTVKSRVRLGMEKMRRALEEGDG